MLRTQRQVLPHHLRGGLLRRYGVARSFRIEQGLVVIAGDGFKRQQYRGLVFRQTGDSDCFAQQAAGTVHAPAADHPRTFKGTDFGFDAAAGIREYRQ